MTNTPNFNFTIAEGTDTVNLLTQLYPNFTSLDTILQAIKESGTTTAVTTKVGTVHQIVRNVADCNVIRWVNTANYTAGDTFTVDGNAVTATAMDGSSLPAGAFVINQSSLAILNGSVLTFVGVPGVSSVAASAVTYDNTGSGLTASDVQNAIDEVVGDIPTGFAATAITYDNSGSGLIATQVQDAIDELAQSAESSDLGALVNITSGYNSYATAYVTPADGYLLVDVPNGSRVDARIYGSNSTAATDPHSAFIVASNNVNQQPSVFIRKCMKIFMQSITGSATVEYVPFV